MKKIFKISCILLFSLLIISISKNVQANSINKISMDIYIDSNGDATITEKWECNTTKGTEVYHPYYNLGNSEIKNLKVKEDGNYYQTLSTWKTSGTLEDKANKCGINKISNGIELCWGISNYGRHTYTAEYTITKFVSELTDSQMIYWQLIPYDFSDSIGNVYIKIHTDFNIADTVDVWGYGNYGGTAYVYNGYIEMQSDGRLDKSEYMTILVKFPKGTFNTTNKLNYDFNHYYNLAEDGAEHYTKGEGSSFIEVMRFILSIMLPIILVAIIPIASKNTGSSSKIDFGEAGKKIPKDINYFRDIPCNGDIFKAYYICYQYNLLKNKTDVLGAIILKWLKDGVIRIEQKEKNGIFKKEDTVIILNETDITQIENVKENELFKMLKEASIDGILENKEFEKWCKNSYSRILMWFDTILEEQRDKLVKENLIKFEEKTAFKFIKSKKYIATMELKNEAYKLAGLKRYLKEYTLIKDREAIEVELFEEYLIFAQIMGIAQQVAKDFKNLYPEIIEQSNFNSYDNIIFINYCSRNGINQANSAKARAESYSSGGGGFSSGGGGGGSFGGGGGRRRLPLKAKIIK